MSRHYSRAVPRAPRSLLLNEAGLPVQWLNWQEAAPAVTDRHMIWSAVETVVTLHGGTQRSGERSVLVPPAVVALQMPRGVPTREQAPLCNRLLFERDRYICMYCGTRCREHDLSSCAAHPTTTPRSGWSLVKRRGQ